MAAVPNGSCPSSLRRRRGRVTASAPVSSRIGSGSADLRGRASTSVSLCAPQPWSTLTTRPSDGDHSLPQTPKARRRPPASGRKKPQVEQGAVACTASSAVGPRSPRYQRSAAAVAPLEGEHPQAAEAELPDLQLVLVGSGR